MGVALPGPEGQAGPERGGRGQAAQGAPRHQGRLPYFNHRVPTPPPLPLREGRQVEIIWTYVGDPDMQDPLFLGLLDPDPLVRDTDPDPYLFLMNVLGGLK